MRQDCKGRGASSTVCGAATLSSIRCKISKKIFPEKSCQSGSRSPHGGASKICSEPRAATCEGGGPCRQSLRHGAPHEDPCRAVRRHVLGSPLLRSRSKFWNQCGAPRLGVKVAKPGTENRYRIWVPILGPRPNRIIYNATPETNRLGPRFGSDFRHRFWYQLCGQPRGAGPVPGRLLHAPAGVPGVWHAA